MELHWDGNNTDMTERNKSAAFGTGTTPPTSICRASSGWRMDPRRRAAGFPSSFPSTQTSPPAARRSTSNIAPPATAPPDFSGEYVGRVTPLAEIGTDRRRLDSYTYTLAVNQATLYAGYPWRFTKFRKTHGYANMPLDGIWLRAPYLHNGSVPSLRDLLEPAAGRRCSGAATTCSTR
jgi:hypothetical protein